jgi:hypothetical protein
MRDEYERQKLGKGARGKYFARFNRGVSYVLLALIGPTARITERDKPATRKPPEA